MSEHRGSRRTCRTWGLALAAGLTAAGCIQGDRGAPGPAGQGTEGPPGEIGDPTPGQASISSVLPGTVYRQHDVDVLVSGFATSFDESTTLDFGEGVEVVSLDVMSPTALRARLVIAPDAPLTTRDVVIGDSTYAGAFSVEDPLSAHVVDGWPAPQQGSLVLIEALQRDIARPFGNEPVTFLRDGEDELSPGQVKATTAYATTFYQFIDVDAPAGQLDAVVESDGVTSVAPRSVTVTARAAIPLTAGTNASSISEARGTALHSLPASDVDRWVHFVTGPQPGRPTFFALPGDRFEGRAKVGQNVLEGSRFAEVTILVPAGSEPHLVAFDPADAIVGDFEITVDESPASELVPGAVQFPGAFDWYYFTGSEGDLLHLAILDGPTTGCGQFAATLQFLNARTGQLLFTNTDICPGYLKFAHPSTCANPVQCLAPDGCGDLGCCTVAACLEEPLEIVLPEDGEYAFRIVSGGGAPVFDYSMYFEVTTP